jgi:hypothetical protein
MIISALAFLGLLAVIYVIAVIVVRVMPQFNVSFYPAAWLGAAALAPLFLPRPLAAIYLRHSTESPPLKQALLFFAFVIVPVVLMAGLTEALVLNGLLSQLQDISLTDILFAPLNQRYTIRVVFGQSFLTTAVVTTTLFSFLLLPGRIGATLRRRSKP